MCICTNVYTLGVQCQTVSPPGGAGCGQLNPLRHQRLVITSLEWRPTLGNVIGREGEEVVLLQSTTNKIVLVPAIPRELISFYLILFPTAFPF